ncbi:MAG: hypothetical protein IJD58_04540 [Lachnospiraceae bacterium]|nr:hypothetical protein [Lachnospiraceae bacterium]
MVTTNAGNSNSNDNRPRNSRSVEGEKKEKRIYTTDNRNSDRQRSNFKRDGQGKQSGEYKPRSDNGEYKPRSNSGEYKPRSGNGGGYSNNRNNGGYSNSGFGGRGFDKDKDEETPVRRSKPKTDSKPKEQQPDKFEIINRIEKEKKAMKKKHTESRGDQRPAKHTARPKRSGNIDWTREYENDSYDDDDLDMYL